MKYLVASVGIFFLITGAVLAQADDGFARRDQLDELSAQMREVAAGLQTKISDAQSAMGRLKEGAEQSEKEAEVNAYFDSIEEQALLVLQQVSLNSDFMDALDDTRAEIIILIRRNELDLPSTGRDQRLAALAVLKDKFEDQYLEVQGAERTIIGLIAQNNVARSEIIKNSRVFTVSEIVQKLGLVTEGLTDMATVLETISDTAVKNQEQLSTLSQN